MRLVYFIYIFISCSFLQVQNLKTVTLNRQGQYVLTGAGMAGAVTPGAAADEVRVDCCLMTNDGRNVVTGSSLGPPQVWDMAVRILYNIASVLSESYSIHCPFFVSIYFVTEFVELYFICINTDSMHSKMNILSNGIPKKNRILI